MGHRFTSVEWGITQVCEFCGGTMWLMESGLVCKGKVSISYSSFTYKRSLLIDYLSICEHVNRNVQFVCTLQQLIKRLTKATMYLPKS